ncbi:MAG: ATP synthase F0 subunit B [Thermodesulfobacteriota bacterium]|jgi:F-type H+-transporting ATPase subunit b|nr:MAG: ATP synthase F0 subunit B [Thermodesulfobacteriota bacterium]
MFSSVNIIGIDIIPGLLVIQGLIFLFVLWFLNKILFKPVLKIIREREERTEGFLNQAEQVDEKAEKTLELYNEKFRQARKEAVELKRKIILEGAEKREAVIDKARKEAQGFLEEMRRNIAEEAERTKKTLHQQVDAIGRIMAQKALGRSV